MEALKLIRQSILLALAIILTIRTRKLGKLGDLENEIYCALVSNILWVATIAIW